MKKKQILFIHQNFPGQFKSLAPHLADLKNYEVFSLSWKKMNKSDIAKDNDTFTNMDKVKHHQYTVTRSSSDNIFNLAQEFETKMIRADAVAIKCKELKEKGLNPDLIIGHPGWGETIFLDEIWPDSKKISYFEFYYNTKNSDIDFDSETREINQHFLSTKLIARNAPLMLPYLTSNKIITPTKFQKSTAPDFIKNKIDVVHDGIDTELIKPASDKASLNFEYRDSSGIEKKLELTKENKIITFVNRNLEPYRGYHSFMRSLPYIQKEHPDSFILIIGGDSYSYGAAPSSQGNKNAIKSYKQQYFDEIKEDLIDVDKVIYTGRVSYNAFLSLLDLSSVHVYLTYPFVLSWSMLEAMALEKVIVGSNTKPVKEIIDNNKNGILVDFFDYQKIAEQVNNVLSDPSKYSKLKKNARKTVVERYDLKTKSLPMQMKLIEEVLNE